MDAAQLLVKAGADVNAKTKVSVGVIARAREGMVVVRTGFSGGREGSGSMSHVLLVVRLLLLRGSLYVPGSPAAI